MFYISLLSVSFISTLLTVLLITVIKGNIQGIVLVLLCLAIDLALGRIGLDAYRKDHRYNINSWFFGCSMVLAGIGIFICGLIDQFSILSVLGLLCIVNGFFISKYNDPNLKQSMRRKFISQLPDVEIQTRHSARELLIKIINFINTPNDVSTEFKLTIGTIGRFVNELVKREWEINTTLINQISTLLDSYVSILSNPIVTERSQRVLCELEKSFEDILSALKQMYDSAIAQEIDQAEVQMKVLQNHLKSKGYLDDFSTDATLD